MALYIVASELKDPICHSDECQIGSFSSDATICKLRTCNTKLPIDKGQYTHVPRERYYCTFRTSNLKGHQYHLLFECNHFIELRKKYLPTYYVKKPSVFKFVTFMKVFNYYQCFYISSTRI